MIGVVAHVGPQQDAGKKPHHDEAVDEKLDGLGEEQGAHHDEKAGEDDEGDVARPAQLVELDREKAGHEGCARVAPEHSVVLEKDRAEQADGDHASRRGGGQRPAVPLRQAAHHDRNQDRARQPAGKLRDMGKKREQERADQPIEEGSGGAIGGCATGGAGQDADPHRVKANVAQRRWRSNGIGQAQ